MDKLLILLTRLVQLFSFAKPAKPTPEPIPTPPAPVEPPKEPKPQEKPVKLGDGGLTLLKDFEGLRLKAYLCQANVWTIGYGHTKGVKSGDEIDVAQAEQYLKEDVSGFETGVLSLSKAPLNQNQFDALVCFAFNVGLGALGSSTLLKKLNAQDYPAAADQFLVWNKVRIDGKLQVSNGLARRRKAERELFLKV